MSQRWLTVMDAAEALGVTPAAVRRRIYTGAVASRFGPEGRQVLIGETGASVPPVSTTPRPRHRLTLMSWTVLLLGVIAVKYGVRSSHHAGPAEASAATAEVSPLPAR